MSLKGSKAYVFIHASMKINRKSISIITDISGFVVVQSEKSLIKFLATAARTSVAPAYAPLQRAYFVKNGRHLL